MRVYADLQAVEPAPERGRMVAIGVFDGVHLGHQAIIKAAVAGARGSGAVATVVTFYPHPEAVLRPRSAPRALTSPARKAELLGGLGVEEMVVVGFDREFARLLPEAFCRAVLSDRLSARAVFVGENFRFGRDGSGSLADLKAYGRTHGFAVEAMPLVWEAGSPVSSTRIRESLRRGDVAEAARLLGRPHQIEGMVSAGAGRGRSLNAPTANLTVERETALPRLGVYVTSAAVDDGHGHAAVTSVGTNPTFEKSGRVRVETLLLGFEGDLYGRRLRVDFLYRIRGQRRFPDADTLREQIEADIEVARDVHRRLGTVAR